VEIPEYWTRFITSNTLMGKYFEIGETDDESGAGADLKLLTPEQTLDEATNCWPGIGVAPDGYVPVASCLIGTGDYYYINVNDGPGGPLYRIYHEAVGEHGYKANEAVAVVLSNYERLLEYVEP
jgi:hypothetical protein